MLDEDYTIYKYNINTVVHHVHHSALYEYHRYITPKCPICTKIFDTKWDCYIHMKQHKLTKCRICLSKESFCDSKSYDLHGEY